MKDKILIFIIGLLLGAVITASGLLIYEKINNNSNNQMLNGERMQMMERPDGETPPEKPSGTDNDSNRLEPPSKNNSNSSNKTN